MVTSGRQNTLTAAFSKTWTCLRMAGWPARAGVLERASMTRMLFRSVQFREANCLSDVAPSAADVASSARTR
jgi:hypothetical protein